jgi:hypothetical protein
MEEPDLDEKIFDFAYLMALRDATVQQAFPSSGKGSKKLLIKCTEAREALSSYIESIFAGRPEDFYEVESKVEESFNAFLKMHGSSAHFTFGNAQKLINISAKYMYMATFGRPELRGRFAACHCPMDAILIRTVVSEADKKVSGNALSDEERRVLQEFLNVCAPKPESGKGKHLWRGAPWSRVTVEHYREFQKAVCVLARAEGIHPLEYDYLHWQN